MEMIILDLFGGDNSVDVLMDGANGALSCRSGLYIPFIFGIKMPLIKAHAKVVVATILNFLLQALLGC